MNKCGTIAILFHEATAPNQMPRYRIWHLAQVWKEWGIDVQLLSGANDSFDADVLIPQIDLSVLPRQYRFLQDTESIVLNRNVLDISKSSFSQNLVSMRDQYDGPVIVKTNANSGGKPENLILRTLPPRSRKILRARHALRLLMHFARTGSIQRLAYTRTLHSDNYPIYPSKRQVPRSVFKNSSLVVEKFLPEKTGAFYYSRSYSFLGDEGLAVRLKSEYPVVKGAVVTDSEFISIDESIVAARRALGFDYGKFDYVVHNGEAVLLDVNPTPFLGTAYSREVQHRMVAQLAKGISKWIPGLHK